MATKKKTDNVEKKVPKSKVVRFEVMAFDSGMEFQLPVPVEMKIGDLNSNLTLQVAQVLVKEINLLGHKCLWRRTPKERRGR